MSDRETNTTDATRGSSLRSRVETRKCELEAALTQLDPADHSRPQIEVALNEINGLLTGDLDNIPRIVSAQLSHWLEANKHVNERHVESDDAQQDAQHDAQHDDQHDDQHDAQAEQPAT